MVILHVMADKNVLNYQIKNKVISVFGLSGSGKSTIPYPTWRKLKTTVLHDDAFIISNTDGSSICLEQSYFDKTQDYLDQSSIQIFCNDSKCWCN